MMGVRWSDIVVQIVELSGRTIETQSWEFVIANMCHAPPSHQKVAMLAEECAYMEGLVGVRGGEALVIPFLFYL